MNTLEFSVVFLSFVASVFTFFFFPFVPLPRIARCHVCTNIPTQLDALF